MFPGNQWEFRETKWPGHCYITTRNVRSSEGDLIKINISYEQCFLNSLFYGQAHSKYHNSPNSLIWKDLTYGFKLIPTGNWMFNYKDCIQKFTPVRSWYWLYHPETLRATFSLENRIKDNSKTFLSATAISKISLFVESN